MKTLYSLIFAIVTLFLSAFCLAQEGDPGMVYFQSGRFEEAAAYWEESLAKVSADRSPSDYLDQSIQLAAAYYSLGHLQRALEILQKAEPTAAKLHDAIRQADLLSQLADIYLAMRKLNSEDLRRLLGSSLDSATPAGMLEKAQQYLERAETMVKAIDTEGARLVLSNILNKKGNLFAVQKKYERAIESYEESEFLAEKAEDAILAVKASLNRLQAMVESGEADSLENELRDKIILQRVIKLPDSHDKAFTLIGLASLVQSSPEGQGQSLQRRRYAYDTLQQALATAKKLQDNLSLAYAKSYLAQLYAEDKRYEEAIELTKQAIFYLQGGAIELTNQTTIYSHSVSTNFFLLGGRPDLLFRWEWQQGKYLREQGKLEEALATYERAKEQLQIARRTCRCSCQNVQDFYVELVDLRLQQPAGGGRAEDQNFSLIKDLESSKSVELQTYLSACETPKQPLDSLDALKAQLPQGTVIFYPMVLSDRIEFLLISRSGIQRLKPVLVKREKLIMEVEKQLDNFREFPLHLEEKPGYLENKVTHNLYQWLIKPLERTLEEQHINTIVIVPHGNLMGFPFAALFDGQKYLVEKYALAVTPGLELTDLTHVPTGPMRALLVGSTSFSRLIELPSVKIELNHIKEVLKEVDILQGEEFTLANIEKKLAEHAHYSIIHFSTHGYFGNSAEETFLQTYDARLSLDVLEELIKNRPLKLLTLSASQTALKGENYSLTLMGSAVKTGARSVLASLWNVSDEATAELMVRFYQHWQRQDFFDKAKALQQAQLDLLKMPKFKHPYYWASFVLIGNWQ